MALIETTVGGLDIPAGTYPVKCIGIKADTITPGPGMPDAGVEKPVFRWLFALQNPDNGEVLETDRITSKATGPSSKTSEFLVALIGPEAGKPGLKFDEADLIGKKALATVTRDAMKGAKIESLTAMPREARTVRAAVEESAPATADDLPF